MFQIEAYGNLVDPLFTGIISRNFFHRKTNIKNQCSIQFWNLILCLVQQNQLFEGFTLWYENRGKSSYSLMEFGNFLTIDT